LPALHVDNWTTLRLDCAEAHNGPLLIAAMKLTLSLALLIVSAAPGFGQQNAIATIAELRALAPAKAGEQREVAVRGYHAPNDGGGGIFVWSPGSTSADDEGMTIEPAGHKGAGRWVRALPEPGVVSPLYFGARCDGSGDDAVAINRAIDTIRNRFSRGGTSPLTGILRLPAEPCTLKTTVNATRLASASVTIEGTGGRLLCEAASEPCIDAMDSALLSFRDITIFGSDKDMPRIGLQVGRPASHASAAGMYLDHITIDGSFSLAAFYNLNAETQLVLKLNVSNRAAGGYGAIYDGLNHFDAKSAFVPVTEIKDAPESMNDNTCVDCRITSSGSGGTPLWAGGTAELTFVNSYISNFNTGVGAVLYNWNNNLNFDAHFEAAGLTSVFLLAGTGRPRLDGLIYREHAFFGQVSLFALDRGVKSATLEDVDINIGRIHGRGQWFDDPAKYTVSGRVAGVKPDGWATPGGGFSGTMCFAAKCVTQ